MSTSVKLFALACVIATCCSVSALNEPNYLNVASEKKCEPTNGLNSRIIEGKIVPVGGFPYMASLRRKSLNKHFCGGSIINSHWILTAAHCLAGQKAGDMFAVVGTNKLDSGGKAYPISFVTHHPEYNRRGVINDVGLVRVAETIEFNKLVLPVALANSNIDVNHHPATLSGWGRFLRNGQNLPNDMQYFVTCLLSTNSCVKEIGVGKNMHQKICTFTRFGQGACNGDSGSPLVSEGVQIGIASYVLSDCASGYPDVYTKVYSFLGWINSTISSL